jgi:UDP:flavonoid glycosyltransferase YjiC (YdhE family)
VNSTRRHRTRSLRVIVAVRPYRGHLHSIIPVAQALATAGHQVVVASAATLASTVYTAGLDWMPAGLDHVTVRDIIDPEPDEPRDDPDFGLYAIGHKVADLLDITLGSFRPDLILRDSTDLAATVAAEVLGVPLVTYGITSFIDRDSWLLEGADRTLAVIRSAYGLDPDLKLEALSRGLYLAVVPPDFESGPLPMTEVQHVAYRPWDGGGETPTPAWLSELPDQPTVLVTLGTVFNDRPDLFRVWCHALAEDGCNVICTLGPDVRLADVGAVPSSVRVERFLPHSVLLPYCSVTLCHTGLNTMLGSLWAGVPVVGVPMGSDQEHNAARCAELGLGVHLDEDEATAAAVVGAVHRILDDSRFRDRISAFVARTERLPSVGDAVHRLEAEAPSSITPLWERRLHPSGA